MLIYCPIKGEKEVQPLLDAGADIFYAGIKSNLIFGSDTGIANRRPWDYANFISKNELKKAINLIHKKNKKINITINEHFYSSKQRIQDVKFVKDAIDNIKKYNTFKKYNTYIKNMHYNIYNTRCLNKCFYK